jgi:transposase
MKTARKCPLVKKRFYRPEQSLCPECQSHLRRAVTLSERTVITLQGAIKVVHAGYRCPNVECAARTRTYRSAQADSLALPGFPFGLDIVLLVGQLRLGQHQTVDEAHRNL